MELLCLIGFEVDEDSHEMTDRSSLTLLFIRPFAPPSPYPEAEPPLFHTQNEAKFLGVYYLHSLSFSSLLLLRIARLLATKQDEQVVMGEWMTHAGTSKGEDVLNLMGLEKCHENDEECLKRRMVAEAHLDYIIPNIISLKISVQRTRTSVPRLL
ncbi:hypothetical protein CK203_084782 [Vitis vinifera]|uniref:Phytosulfokine n=1 Tax=Vitis vinifera TaxID=29760 RepID=A0A438EKN6_VITVI|nr:hypothetical protein CK203_084782 [Vitis vinifera]